MTRRNPLHPVLAMVVAVCLTLLSCGRPPNFVPTGVAANSSASVGSSLHGAARFHGVASPFTTQATMSDVGPNSTVSLLDGASGQTLATTLTDGSGNFMLNLPNFKPATNSYVLEAVKGLNTNAANNDAIRVRTLIQFVGGGWQSMTSNVPNGPIYIDTGTTAVCLITSLRAGTTNPVSVQYVGGVSNEVNVVNDGATPNAFSPPGSLNISQTEYSTVYGLINQAFASNVDAFSAVAYDAGSQRYLYALHTAPSISFSGSSFTVTGTNFDPTLGNNKVYFAGVAATLTSATATTLNGTIPGTAPASGQVTVQIGNLVYLGPTYSLPPTITSFSPGSGAPGASITITGTNFSSVAANDVVKVNGTVATVTAASGTSLTFTVPVGATTGTITVTVGGNTATSATSFTVNPGTPFLSAISPSSGVTGDTITLEGLFGTTATVNFPGASVAGTVLGANRVQVTVPAGATGGLLTVTTSGGGVVGTTNGLPFRRISFGIGLQPFNATYNQCGYAQQFPALSTAETSFGYVTAGNYVYVIGGSNGGTPTTAVQRAAINADGTLTGFTTVAQTLTTARYECPAVVVGNNLYVLGGMTSGGVYLKTIEVAPLNADGTLAGGFTVSAKQLGFARSQIAVAQVGSYLYAIGGSNGSDLTTVESATLDTSGNLTSNFTSTGRQLLTGRASTQALVVGTHLYALGGHTGAGDATSIEDFPIAADGTISNPSTSASTLATGVSRFGLARFGTTVYVVGGYSGTTYQGVVQTATVTAGALGSFANSALTLATGRRSPGVVVAGNNLFAFGGLGASGELAGAEVASLDASSGLSNFSVSASTLANVTSLPGYVATPGHIYVIGGQDMTAGVAIASVQEATVSLDGSLVGTFKTTQNLTTARYFPMVARIGSYVYVLGGGTFNDAANYNSVERATVNPDGTLGPFSAVSTVFLAGALNDNHWGGALVCAGPNLVAMGGWPNTSPETTVDYAAIDSAGNLANFAAMPINMTGPGAQNVGVFMLGNTVYYCGGLVTGNVLQNNVQTVTFTAAGAESGTANAANYLAGPLEVQNAEVIGNQAYQLGGYNAGGLMTAEVSTITGGVPGPWTTTGPSMASAPGRWNSAAFVVGNYCYLLGGKQTSGAGSTSQNIIDVSTLQ